MLDLNFLLLLIHHPVENYEMIKMTDLKFSYRYVIVRGKWGLPYSMRRAAEIVDYDSILNEPTTKTRNVSSKRSL